MTKNSVRVPCVCVCVCVCHNIPRLIDENQIDKEQTKHLEDKNSSSVCVGDRLHERRINLISAKMKASVSPAQIDHTRQKSKFRIRVPKIPVNDNDNCSECDHHPNAGCMEKICELRFCFISPQLSGSRHVFAEI